MALTARQVETAKPKEKDYNLLRTWPFSSGGHHRETILAYEIPYRR